MTNLPITSSNPSPAKGRAELTPPSGAPLPAQTDDMSDVQSVEPFGALLAQQMDEARILVLIAPSSAIAIDTKTTTDAASLISEGDQNKTSAASDTSNDPASALIAMLQLPHEIKTPVIKDTTHSMTVAVHSTTGGKAASHQPTASIDAAQAQTGFGMATADNQVIRSTPSLAITNSAVSTNNLPGTPLPAQDATPPIAASDVMPNMPVNNRLPDTRQAMTTPLGNNNWANEFSQKINWMSTQQNQIAELHLNPPDLGPLDVVLKVSGNQATALFTSPHGAVRDAVENA
ncbi:MAG: flagellar hook-length control protein FliK, partial [Gallionella sp.]|nr:flagellar hook-length control protein FliK [Gallionella sp.]